MTSLLAGAFDEVKNAARKAVSRGKVTAAVILMIDEADTDPSTVLFETMDTALDRLNLLYSASITKT